MKLMKCVIYILIILLFSTSFAKSGTGFFGMAKADNYLIVDKLENGQVICEDSYGDIIEIREDMFRKLPKEGDVVRLARGGMYKVDRLRTVFIKAKLKRRFDSLFTSG